MLRLDEWVCAARALGLITFFLVHLLLLPLPHFSHQEGRKKGKKKKKAESAGGSSPSTRSDAIRCDLTQPNYAFLVSLTKPELDYRARFDSAL